ncbi:MAG TPA: ATP-binding SpoIIE family protein phosphatase [Blastocatellia bacterium]|nr:ATP-binding SpoIIE family protein phosphatase [Blastocatellia bacterium]
MANQIHLQVREKSAVAEARREVTGLAQAVGFSENDVGRVAIVVTEAASNLVKHTAQGQLLARAFDLGGVAVIEALALDQGPGIANVGESLRDGFSTAGSPGTGLGAIKRLSDKFDIYSAPGKGVALVAQLWSRKPVGGSRPASLEIGAVCLAMPGEVACGDAWAVEWRDGHCVILVADGLGHGPDAAAAAMAAVNALRTHPQLAPAALIEFAHGALRSTRGAALAVADIDLAQEVRYAGIGNIASMVRAPDGARHMVSYAGIVGHEVRKIQEFVYPWSQDSLLVMHSDGLATHWNLDQYPGLAGRHPSLIAGVLYRDFARGRDDVAVVVAKK